MSVTPPPAEINGYCSSCLPATIYGRPESLACVSRAWRHLVENTPQLWTVVHFVLGVKQSLSLIDLYLKRSRRQAVDMRITGTLRGGLHDRSLSELRPDYMRKLESILFRTNVIRRLEIHVNCPDPLLLYGIGISRRPMLEELVVHYPQQKRRNRHAKPSFSLADLKHVSSIIPPVSFDDFLAGNRSILTTLTLSGQWIFLDFSDPCICLASLTHLTLIGEPMKYVQSRRRFLPGDKVPFVPDPIVMIPSLQKLVLKLEPYVSNDRLQQHYLLKVFQNIRAPVLNKLVLDLRALPRRRLQSLEDSLPKEGEESLLSSVRRLKVYTKCRGEGAEFVDALSRALPGSRIVHREVVESHVLMNEHTFFDSTA